MRVQLTVRIPVADADYIGAQARDATRTFGREISVNQVVAALLHRAITEGWKVVPAHLETSRPVGTTPLLGGPGPTTETPGE